MSGIVEDKGADVVEVNDPVGRLVSSELCSASTLDKSLPLRKVEIDPSGFGAVEMLEMKGVVATESEE